MPKLSRFGTVLTWLPVNLPQLPVTSNVHKQKKSCQAVGLYIRQKLITRPCPRKKPVTGGKGGGVSVTI